MSLPSETSGRPLASSIQQPEASTQQPTLSRKRRQTSQSSDERIGGTKLTSSRRRQSTRKEALFASPHTGSSRGESSTMQRSASPTQMSPGLSSVAYTRTGRISKAKKGRKVHNCECGRSYTRAEHLRRHQKNHAEEPLVCKFPECGKTFFRIDLLQRHQERHNEIGKDPDSPQHSTYSPGGTEEPEPRVSLSGPSPSSVVTSVSQSTPFYSQTVAPVPASAPDPSLGKRLPSHSAQRTPMTMQVQVEEIGQNPITWTDPFGQSPVYSSSSGYASPVPGDYANMFAHHPYGPPANRTRTSSNASFIQSWEIPSQSPASATSTMAYPWTSNDKSPVPSNLPYLTTSYPMTSMPMSAGVNPMAEYGHFGPKSLAQRDEEEQAFLFPEQSFGMGQIAHTYPFDLYLNNYWRLFHPSFPVVHRPTLDGINEPPMLQAAMIAIGGQYSTDSSVKRKSRILHDRCMKLLDKRNLDVLHEPERLCDQQALFLVEVLSQYRARRAAKTLSTRFETLYQKLCQNFGVVASNIVEIVSTLVRPENATQERWMQWIDLSGQQRLLLCCYILESHQATLLARNPRPSIVQLSGFDLPFPAHSALWDAANSFEWAMASQQYSHLPSYVSDANSAMSIGPYDCFQSSLLIAHHYNYFNNPTPYLGSPAVPAIDHLLDVSSVTKHQLLTAKLLQVTPIRALLAVSGESWILSEKVPSPQAFAAFKGTLRSWINGLWTSANEPYNEAAKDALKLAIEILQHAMEQPVHDLRMELGADMGLYFASLVIWAVTVAANTRINVPQAHAQALRYQSHSPLPSTHFPTTPTQLSANTSQHSTSPNPAHPTMIGLGPHSHTSPALPLTPTNMLHSEIAMTAECFLGNVLLELDFLGTVAQWPRDVAQWQQGCGALMRWVKMRLRNGALEGRDSVVAYGPTSAGTGRGGDGLGELLDGVIGVLEKIMRSGWEGWGV